MRYLSFILILFSVAANAQHKEYKIGPRGDTLNVVDAKGRKQGRWVISVPELRGERGYEEQGVFINGKKEGTWRRFSLEGDLLAVENFRWGNKNGQSVYYNQMGDPVRQESWRAVNPDNPYDTVKVVDPNDPSKVLRYDVVKMEGYSFKHGTWKYFDNMSGTIAKTEEWYFDKPARKEGDELLPIDVSDGTVTADANADVKPVVKKKPQAILDYEKKNSGKKKIKVRDGNTGG